MTKINMMNQKNLQLAEVLLRGFRPVQFVKKVCGISVAEMVRQGWLYELKAPNPHGFFADPSTGEQKHDGSVVNTGNLRSVFGEAPRPSGKSNSQLKREDRKAFFDSRRARKQRAA